MLDSLEQGKQVHAQIIKTSFDSYIFVGNALVDMYAKLGSMANANSLFGNMPKLVMVSWNSMIAGYADNNCGMDVFHLVAKMPWSEHHSCIVDLIGRAGCLNEAHNYIREKSLQLSVVIWQSLLATCRVYGNIELGEEAVKCILALEPQDVTTYVQLSNIYAAFSMWDDVNKMRIMKDIGLKKKLGYSWIEVKNKVHAFLVGDRSHPQSKEIYAKLQWLTGLMKDIGHIPDVHFMLHDKKQEQVEVTIT
eukprot:PITA_36132